MLLAIWVFYTALTLLSLGAIAAVSERFGRISALMAPALLTPFYRELLRWAKIRAIVMEFLRVDYEDRYPAGVGLVACAAVLRPHAAAGTNSGAAAGARRRVTMA